MIIPAFKGKVDESGVLRMSQTAKFREWISHNLRGKEVQVVVKPKKKLRSLNENNYYWGVVIQLLAEHTGYAPSEMHELCKVKFLPPKRITLRNGKNDQSITIAMSTTELTTSQMENYLSEIRLWAIDFWELKIPLPNEVDDGKEYVA